MSDLPNKIKIKKAEFGFPKSTLKNIVFIETDSHEITIWPERIYIHDKKFPNMDFGPESSEYYTADEAHKIINGKRPKTTKLEVMRKEDWDLTCSHSNLIAKMGDIPFGESKGDASKSQVRSDVIRIYCPDCKKLWNKRRYKS